MPIDYSKYPPDWKTRIVPAVLERAGNKCEHCGLENRQMVFRAKHCGKIHWFKSVADMAAIGMPPELVEFWAESRQVKVVLTVAHLDHDECNHAVQLDRLKALCQLCHLRYDAAEKARRRKAAGADAHKS